ncbi:MAG: gliding motility-associated C-terminal domain-containing protein [Saprospiraceae bacterium]
MIPDCRVILRVFIISSYFLLSSGYLLSQCNFSEGPIGERCNTALYICGDQLDGFKGKLRVINSTDTIWLGNNLPKDGVCNGQGQFNNTTWFSFTACSPTVHIKIRYFRCVHPLGNIAETGIQSGLYSGCRKSSSVACDEQFGNPSGVLDLKYDGFRPGELVFFVLDGYASSVCEFEVEVIEGIDTSPVPVPDPTKLAAGYISGLNSITCSQYGEDITYNLTPPQCTVATNTSCAAPSNINPLDSVCYVWQISPTIGRYFTNKDSVGKTVDIVFTTPGKYTISVDNYFHPFYGGSCANAACGSIATWEVVVLTPDTIHSPIQYLCPGQIIPFCGYNISSDSTVTCSTDICNVFIQKFEVKSDTTINPVQTFCAGEVRTFCGKEITTDTTVICDTDPCNIIVQKFTITPSDTIDLPLTYICPGNYFDFCGQRITRDTTIYCNSSPCKIQKRQFIVGTNKLNNLGIQYICAGDSFMYQGKSFNTDGNYEITDTSDCALIHRFSVKVLQLSSSISAERTILNCNHREIQLNGAHNVNDNNGTISYNWTSSNGSSLGQNATLPTKDAGTYHVRVTYSILGSVCSSNSAISLTADFKKPTIVADIPVIKCTTTRSTPQFIHLSTPDLLASSEWTKPSGEIISTLNIQIDSINATLGKPYLFKATGLNGCVVDTSFQVPFNFQKATISLKGDDLTCYNPKDTLTMATDIAIDSIRWSKTSPTLEFYGSDPSKRWLEVTDSGIYRVEVLASTSKCWSDNAIDIRNNVIYPDLAVDSTFKWYCNTKSLDVIPELSLGNEFEYHWTTTDGSLLSNPKFKNLTAGSVGTYHINIFNKANGCNKTGALNIVNETNTPQDIVFSTEDVLCNGQKNGTLYISNTFGGFEPYTYYLEGSKLNASPLKDLSAGKYTLEVRDKYECRYMLDFVIADPPVLTITTNSEFTIPFHEVTTLVFNSNYSDSDIEIIKWTNSKGDILGDDFTLDYSSEWTDIVSVEITTHNGCKAKSSIKINIDNELKMYFPNIFSPNGDGVNDRLIIFKNTIPATIGNIYIYDRFGNKVFSQNSFEFESDQNGWDGRHHGKNVESGVYIMVIEATDFAGQRHIIKKDLTIVR